MDPNAAVTARLAQFVADSRWEDIPEACATSRSATLLNILGAAFAGCRDAAVEHALAVLQPFAGAAEATIIGRSERADILTAAFVNARQRERARLLTTRIIRPSFIRRRRSRRHCSRLPSGRDAAAGSSCTR